MHSRVRRPGNPDIAAATIPRMAVAVVAMTVRFASPTAGRKHTLNNAALKNELTELTIVFF